MITKKQATQTIVDLNNLMPKNMSAFEGLRYLGSALVALCDTYAQPNDENPLGMVDNPRDLRQIIAHFFLQTPILKKKATRK